MVLFATIVTMYGRKKSVKKKVNTEQRQRARLITVLNELEDEVERQNSWKHALLRGSLYGIGTVIGATILIALIGSAFAITIKTFGIEKIPILGPYVEKVANDLNSRNAK
jgi:hypothetical protein